MLAELALIVSKAVVIYVQLFLIATVSISNHVVVGNQKEFGSKHRVAPSHHGRNHVELLAWAIKFNIPYDHKSGYENMKNQLDKIAEKTAKDNYLINKGQIGGLLGHYLFVHFLHNESSFLSDSNYFTQNLGSSKQKGSTFLRYISKGANISISEDNFYTMKDTVHSSMDSHDDIEWYSQQIVRPRKKREANLIQSSSSTIHSLLSKNIKYRKPSLSQTNGGFVIQKKQGVSQSHNGTEKHANSSKKELVLSSDVNSSEVHSLRRMKRQTTGTLDFQDPIYPYQWHLHNYGNIISDMFNPGLRMDINITGVWERGITGKGVTVCVIDDGLQWSSLDLVDNYSPEGSWDLNGNDKDPMPDPSKGKNHHGTRCAGEIAAAANTYCAVGVAFQSKIAGIRMLDGPMTDSMEAAAFTMGMNINDVYSCSWGPKDDGKTVDGPHYLAQIAMQQGVNYGRHGYGSIYVVASGNGGRFKDNCNFDGYANSLYTVTIGAVDDTGNMPYYAEECASMLAVTFSSGDGLHRSIYTTDWTLDGSSGCTGGHTGTSAAAPLAAGMIALALQARPCLTWRDIQYLIVLTAVKVDRDLGHWHKNQAGLSHSHRHGFGLMSAWRLVNAAKAWEPIPWMTIYTTGDMTDNAVIPRKPGRLEVDFTVTAEVLDGYWLQLLEHVQVTLTIEHPRRGDLDIQLMCPSGTISYLATPRSMDTSSEGFNGWAFSTVRCWGEEPYGNWTLTIQDKGQSGPGTLVKWQLKLIGVPLSSEDFRDRLRYVERATSGQYLSDNYSLPCPAAPVQTELVVPVTYKTLKIICLTSLFCLVLGFYETFEYAFCYDDEKKEHSHRMRLALQAQQLARENSNTSTSSNQDATETTRLIPSESIPMRTFNRTTSSEGASGGDGMGNGAIGDGDLGDGAAGEKEELLKQLHSPDIPEEILETLSPDEIRLNMSLGDKLREKVKKNRVKKHSSPEKSSVHDAGAYASIR